MEIDNADQMRDFLTLVNTGAIIDDANLGGLVANTARRAYKLGLIDAMPVEGSDANVDALRITDVGRAYLGSPQPHPVIEARDHEGLSIAQINGLRAELQQSQARVARLLKIIHDCRPTAQVLTAYPWLIDDIEAALAEEPA